jgi:hypothetical protein
LPSLFEARCRLQTSATETRRASKPTGTLDPRRDGDLDLLPFLAVPRPLPCGSGDTRRAALRPPARPQCWFFPLAWVCPTVMPERSPHHEDACGAPVCSEDRRARVEGPSEGRVYRSTGDDVSCLRWLHALRAHARRRSPPRRPSDIRCHRRDARCGGMPATERRTDRDPRSDDAPRRVSPSRRSGCLRPPRHVREHARRDSSLRPSRRLSRSRRPHVSPEGDVLLKGIARPRCGHPRIRGHREYRRLFNPLNFRAWD